MPSEPKVERPLRQMYAEWKRAEDKKQSANDRNPEHKLITIRIRTPLRTFRLRMRPRDTFRMLLEEVADNTDWYSQSCDQQKPLQRLSRHADGRSFVHGINTTLSELKFVDGDLLYVGCCMPLFLSGSVTQFCVF